MCWGHNEVMLSRTSYWLCVCCVSHPWMLLWEPDWLHYHTHVTVSNMVVWSKRYITAQWRMKQCLRPFAVRSGHASRRILIHIWLQCQVWQFIFTRQMMNTWISVWDAGPLQWLLEAKNIRISFFFFGLMEVITLCCHLWAGQFQPGCQEML